MSGSAICCKAARVGYHAWPTATAPVAVARSRRQGQVRGMSARSRRAARATASGPKSAGCNGPFRRSRALRVGLRRRSRATWRWGGGGWHPETTMSTEYPASRHQREPWNKGRLVGQKRPLNPKDVWTIRVRLQMEKRQRDLAMFNLAIDSKLKGCDLVRLKIDDVCAGGRVRERATVVQKKTGRPVQFEIT